MPEAATFIVLHLFQLIIIFAGEWLFLRVAETNLAGSITGVIGILHSGLNVGVRSQASIDR